MTNARRVTEAEALGIVDQTPTDALRKKYEASAYFDVRIPEDQFDRIRLEAREATYRNTQEEEATVAAVDQAIFSRIQEAERHTLAQAGHLLEQDATRRYMGPREQPNALQRAENHLSELAAIRQELRDGKTPTAELAARYERVRMAVQSRDGASLVALSDRASKLREKVADPLGSAQRTLNRMPLNMWRPLGIREW